MITLYKRNAKGKPLVWCIEHTKEDWNGFHNSNSLGNLKIEYGLVGGTLHQEIIPVTKKNVNELDSRVKAKRKEGYKEINELKDSGISQELFDSSNINSKLQYLDSYLPKYSTTSEGFILPMLAKVLEDNKQEICVYSIEGDVVEISNVRFDVKSLNVTTSFVSDKMYR